MKTESNYKQQTRATRSLSGAAARFRGMEMPDIPIPHIDFVRGKARFGWLFYGCKS